MFPDTDARAHPAPGPEDLDEAQKKVDMYTKELSRGKMDTHGNQNQYQHCLGKAYAMHVYRFVGVPSLCLASHDCLMSDG